jgi:hypothetical protein
MKQLTAFVIGFVLFQILFYYIVKPDPVVIPEPVITRCDSIMLANDSLCQRVNVLESRFITYRLGMSFLKDKDKKAYDYLINSGNLKFYED